VPSNYASGLAAQILLVLALTVVVGARNVRVVVALDDMALDQLADSATETNKHSLRSLWSESNDFWDIQMQHDCTGTPGVGRCLFSTNLTELGTADGVLFSAQLFPGLGRFEEVLANISPHTHTILWNTEAVDTFRLGPQLPVLEAKLDWSASYEMHSDVPLLQVSSMSVVHDSL